MSSPHSHPSASSQAVGGSIQAIDSKSIQKITSGQVVVDLQTAVKELVENSLDAGATIIDVKFKDYGLESFEVSDNGSGIREEDLDNIGLNHYTSKLASFDDLAQVKTFGFRGEALSSLCTLAKVSVQSSTAATEPRGWALEFDKMGKVTSKRPCSRSRGTTVNVQSLFHNLPVRRKQFSKEFKKHFAHAQTLLQAYGLISTNLSLNVSNHPAKGSKTFQFQTKSNDEIKQNFSNIFTPKACNLVVDLNLHLKVKPDRAVLRALGLAFDATSEDHGTTVSVTGLISRPVHGQGRNTPDRQFYYINGRPFNPSKISKCVNEVYKQFNTNQYPVILANFVLPTDSYDLNIDPNKRTIFLHSESNLIEALREALGSFCQPYRSTFSLSQFITIPESFTPPTLNTLAQSASSKRKHLAERSANQVDDQDLCNANAIERPSEDSLEISNIKKPKLSETSNSLDDINLDAPDTVAPQRSTPLFKPALSPPLLEVSLDRTQPRQDAIISPEPTLQNGTSISPAIPNVAIDSSPQVSTASSQNLLCDVKSEKNPSPERLSEKPDWIPSILRGDSASKHSSKMVQVTLDTSGASWNTKTKTNNHRKDGPSRSKKVASSSERMRTNLQQFMLGGSQSVTQSSRERKDDEGDDISQHDELSPSEGEEEADDRQLSDGLNPATDQVDHMSGSSDQKEQTQELLNSSDENDLASTIAIPDTRPTSSSHKQNVVLPISRSSNRERLVVSAREIIPARDPTVVSRSINLKEIIKVWEAYRERHSGAKARMTEEGASTTSGLREAGLDQSEREAECALSRNVHQDDFQKMQIIGQFNLGFIIVRRRTQNDLEDDLFIVDQHASDEKFNFEKLQRETKITGQRLLIPKVLDLTAAEEITAMEHLEMLEMNGFSVHIDETAAVGQRVRLLAQPVSGTTSWEVSDLEELLHLIDERGSNELVRPSKTRKMMASRACRMSTMIGDGLSTKQMARIVSQMGTMDQPWSCPHGRPTMRWLARCGQDGRRTDERYRIASWIEDKLDW